MTTWELIHRMVYKGYEFQISRHVGGLRGYFAVFFKTGEFATECDECGERPGPSWHKCGHALTPHRAVVMAARIALDQTIIVPTTKDFEL